MKKSQNRTAKTSNSRQTRGWNEHASTIHYTHVYTPFCNILNKYTLFNPFPPPTLPIPIPHHHSKNPIHPIPISWDAASHRPPAAAGALATASCGTAWPPPPARPPRCAAGGAWPSPRPPRGAPPSRDAESGLGAAGRRGGLGIGSGGVDLQTSGRFQWVFQISCEYHMFG